MSKFAHLHLHTEFSILDGANKASRVVEKANQLGQTSIAMTDHGNMHGAIDFYKTCSNIGIKPIIGCEVYVSEGSRSEKKSIPGKPNSYHLTLISKNLIGYKNLCRLVTLGFTEGFYFKPRIDHEILAQFSEGLICLSGCLSSEFGSVAKEGKDDLALEKAKQYHKIFGDDYYLEVQPHFINEQAQLNEVAKHTSQKLGIPLVATNDCHYLESEDSFAQEVLMCIGTAKLLSDEDRLKHDDGVSLHLKSQEEMEEEMPDFHEAISMPAQIAEKCNLELDFSTYHMPAYDTGKESMADAMQREAKEGLQKRIQEAKARGEEIDEELYNERLELECKIINDMGFPGYFLVVSDFIKWSKNNGVPVGPGRGSAAGSLVSYALYITEVDPIKYKLLFERFLNPERVSLPDIDIDFCINGRSKVIEYVSNKFGKEKVCQILTFGTLKAKAAIKDVGRVLGLSYTEMDKIAKLVPAPRQGFDYPISEALKMEKRLEEYYKTEQGKKHIDLALKLEGLSRHTSTHAAGVVISDDDIVNYMPLMLDKDGQVVSQYSMSGVESIGLVKFDFLGLKTLTVLQTAIDLIKKDTKEEVDLNAISLEDKKTFDLISSGKTIGVFQMESTGITDMIKKLKPSCFEDIVAILALYRPGPLDSGMADKYIERKHGREKVTVEHPLLEPILKDTYGIILYQEQIMQIARDMAGYSLGEADMLRRAMGKKKPEEMAKQREIFVSGSIKKEISEKIANEVFDQMETFARYGFNRSHSVAYALISYQTAYLKTHYPKHFMAALMSHEMSDTDKTLKNFNECRKLKIKINAPDVNKCGVGFEVSKEGIVFGLAALKGVGQKAIEALIKDREDSGSYKSLLDFCVRLIKHGFNRRSLESLICAGGFDWTEYSRAELVERLEMVLKRAASILKEKESMQLSLFGEEETNTENFEPDRDLLPEWDLQEKLQKEKDALGFYLSGHPLEPYREELSNLGVSEISTLSEKKDGSNVEVAGAISFLKLKNTKKGDRYASFVIEDMSGTAEVLVWPRVYNEVSTILEMDVPITLNAKLDIGDDKVTLIANSISEVHKHTHAKASKLIINLGTEVNNVDDIEEIKKLLHSYPGDCPVEVEVQTSSFGKIPIRLLGGPKVSITKELRTEIENSLGEGSVKLS